MSYEPVIGLEVHVQLATEAKLFCGCSTKFGAPANTQVCPVCLGLPGSLPVLNRRALRYGVRAAVAFDCDIALSTKFDRKNYFYPDLPKGYQISQFDVPYASGGAVTFDVESDGGREERRVKLTRIHLEEDAGKSIHDEAGDRSLIDLNRCGTPLLEIVSEPEVRSGAEAAAYLRAIRDVMRWIGVSDVNMEEGSLRCDVNLSLRPTGTSGLGRRTEVKNLNSFANVEKAIDVEARRQQEILERGEEVVQQTRLFDADTGTTRSMRGKEEAHDYRYFPEPDLRPVTISEELVAEERAGLPELPRQRRRRYRDELGLSTADAAVVTATPGHGEFFERLLAADVAAKEASNWFQTVVLREVNERGIDIAELAIDADGIAAVIAAVEAEKISVAAGRDILQKAIDTGDDPTKLLAAAGEQVSDDVSLDGWAAEVIAANGDAVEKIRGGDEKPFAFLMGQVMKLSRGKANPRKVTEILRARIIGE